jgi:hypothetical protein
VNKAVKLISSGPVTAKLTHYLGIIVYLISESISFRERGDADIILSINLVCS